MRRFLTAAWLVAGLVGEAQACSCWGTQSIGSALTRADAVVVARVVRHEPGAYTERGNAPDGVVLEVMDSLKGEAPGTIYVPEFSLCYQSFDPGDFKAGETYVLPLTTPAEAMPRWDKNSISVGMEPDSLTEPIGQWFMLPSCSHNALALRGGKLYTNEHTLTGGQEQKRYLPLTLVRVLLPTGLLDSLGQWIWLGTIGLIALVFALLRRARRNRMRSG